MGVKLFSRGSSLQLADRERVPNCVQIRENKNSVICLRNLLNPDTALRLLAVFLVAVACESASSLRKSQANIPIKGAVALAKSYVVS